jgi:hypothetical protein
MAHARPFWTSTPQDLSNDTKSALMRGDLTPQIVFWVFGSPGGLQVPTFGSVGFTLTLSPKWDCDTFYTLEYPLSYSHNNCDGDVIVVPSTMGIHQRDFLGGALFALTHFRALHSIASHFPSYLFWSIANDIHIIAPPSIVLFAYEHFWIELCVIGLSIWLQNI